MTISSRENIRALIQSLSPLLTSTGLTLTFHHNGTSETLPISPNKSTNGEGKQKLLSLYKETYGTDMSVSACQAVLREVKATLEQPQLTQKPSLLTVNSKQEKDASLDKSQEIKRLYDIIFPHATMQGRSFYLNIPMPDGSTSPFKLTSWYRDGEQARSWILAQYRGMYRYTPRVTSYNSALNEVHSYLITHTQSSEETPEVLSEEGERNPTRKDRRILEVADYTQPASDANVSYARVKEPVEFMGMWRLNGYKTVRLIDTHVEVKRVVRPHSKSKNARYSTVTLLFTDSKGKEKLIEVTDEQLISNELDNKLIGFARYVQTDRERRHFAEFIRSLATEEGVQVQDNTDELAWYKSDDGTLPWGMMNGAELAQGFVDADESPCMPPSLPSVGAKYYGAKVDPGKLSTEYDFYDLWLNQFAPHEDCQVFFLVLIALNMLVSIPKEVIPPGSGVENGTLRIVPEIVGSPNCGKSRSLNAALSENGTQFYHNTPPLLTLVGGGGKGDSAPGKNKLISSMNYQMYANNDYKAKPEGQDLREFKAQHDHRNATIANYFDGPSGGAISSRTGEARGRAIPSGFPVSTCNYDHALYSIGVENDDVGEGRACTFVWGKDVIGNFDVSKLMDEDSIRLQAYLMGQKRRNWLREKYIQCSEELKDTVKFCYDMARGTVEDKKYTWYSTRPRNQTVLMVWGCYLIQEFLSEVMPDHLLYEWINKFVPLLIENRLKRDAYLQKLSDEKEGQSGIETFVLNWLKTYMSKGLGYVRTQKDENIRPFYIEGLPFGMQDIGYRSFVRSGDEEWSTGLQHIAYLVHGKENFGFNLDVIMNDLTRDAKARNIPIGDKRQVQDILQEKGVSIPYLEKKGNYRKNEYPVKVNGQLKKLTLIPASLLFPVAEVSNIPFDEDEEEEEKELPGYSNVIKLGDQEALPDVFSQESIDALV